MKHRKTQRNTQKKRINYRTKTVRSKIIYPKKNKITYTVEPIDAKTRDHNIEGDVYKKYKNGKLVNQVFVSKNKLKEVVESIKKKNPQYLGKNTGGKNVREAEYVQKPGEEEPVVKVASASSFFQVFKEGIASALAFFTIKTVFDAVTDGE